MEIKGQEAKSKATGISVVIVDLVKDKVLVDLGTGKPIPVPLDSLIMSDELREEIKIKIHNKSGKNKKQLSKHEIVLDFRRAPEEIKNPKTAKELHKGDCLGTRSADIYHDFCDNESFRWNDDVGWNFGRQKRLYASNATKEGYSVWMLAHSTYNGSVAKSEKVVNEILDNGDIVENWNENSVMADYTLGEKRVVFVKNACGQYIFWGITEVLEVKPEIREVVHRYLSETYR